MRKLKTVINGDVMDRKNLGNLMKQHDNNHLACVSKAKEKLEIKPEKSIWSILPDLSENKSIYQQKIGLPTLDGYVFVKIIEIVKCCSMGNYTNVTLVNNEIIVVSRTLKEFEDTLDRKLFFRIHNSSIINMSYMKKYIRGDGGQVVMEDDTIIQVSRNRKESFLNAFMKL